MNESIAAFLGRAIAAQYAMPPRIPRRVPVQPVPVCPHCKTVTHGYRFEMREGHGIEAHHCACCHRDVVPIWSAVSHPADWSTV